MTAAAEVRTVGFVGLGILGRPIAEHLLSVGTPLVVHDVRSEATRGLDGHARVADSPRLVATACDVVLVCVQTDEQCDEVVGGAEGLLEGASPGTCVAILSTVHPDTVKRLAELARVRDVDVIDSPLAGRGEATVEDNGYWVLVGGETAAVARVRPVLERFAGRVLHAGPLGSGATLKLAHNVMVYLGYLAVQEALELAHAAGVRDGLVAEVTRATDTLSPQLEVYLDIYERRRRDPGTTREQDAFRTYAALLDKDLRIAVELAHQHGVDLPGSALLTGRGSSIYCSPPR